MANIIPAILESDIQEIQNKLDQLSDLVEWVQIDLMDGQFVDNISVAPPELKQLTTEINLEAHLMVKQPADWLSYLDPAIFRRVYFHIEAVPEPTDLIKEIKESDIEPGLALNLATPVARLEPYAELVDSILFMSVTPGRQGQQFQESALDKIKEFLNQFPDHLIAIDGGINENNIASVAQAGVDNISVGSAIFAAGNIADNLNRLREVLT